MRTSLLHVLSNFDLNAVKPFVLGCATGAILDTLSWWRKVRRLQERLRTIGAYLDGREAAARKGTADN